MKKSRTFLTLLLSVCMVLAMMPSMAFAAATDKTNDIVVVYTNDVHCSIDGYAKVAAYKAEMEAANNYVALVDAGDNLQGQNAGALSRGQYIVDIMNQVGYDVTTPGNHEFDWGMDQFLKFANSESKADYVSATFVDKKSGNPILKPYVIKTFGETKVAFVGISTPETITKSTPAYFQDANGNFIYDFCAGNNGADFYKAVQNAVNDAKAEGAEYVIGLSHLGIDAPSAPYRSTDVIANTTGIDAVIDGHSHSVVNKTAKNKDGKSIPLTQTGTEIANIGELRISENGTISTKLVNDYNVVDANTNAFITAIKDKLTALTEKYVGKTNFTMTNYDAEGNRLVRIQETTVGDFCADAYKSVTGAQIGLVQGGGVRADLKAGNITYGDLVNLNPWGNAVAMIEATGQQILDALEWGAQAYPAELGGFLQVSGLSYEINKDVATPVLKDADGMYAGIKGERRVQNVKVAGTPIDPKKTYTVASTAYILVQNGDGFTMFDKCKDVTPVDGLTDADALTEYLSKKMSGIMDAKYAQTENRITIVEKTYSKEEVDTIQKETAKAIKAAIARKASLISKSTYVGKTTKKIFVKVNPNSEATGYYYRIYNAKGTKVTGCIKTGASYIYSKKLAKGKYTVKVKPYTTVAGERFYGVDSTKTLTVK